MLDKTVRLTIQFYSSIAYQFMPWTPNLVFLHPLQIRRCNRIAVTIVYTVACINSCWKIPCDNLLTYITEGNSDLEFSKSGLNKLLSIATAQTHLLLNGKVYNHLDYVAMGSPLAPALANLFLGHYERLWLNKYQDPSIHFYRRYFDDTFCLFNNEYEALLFFQYLNSRHDNSRFTMEKEANRAFHFLTFTLTIKIPPVS